MIPIPWAKMRNLLLLEAVLFGGCISICSLLDSCSRPLIFGLGLFFSLLLAVTALLFRIDTGKMKDETWQRQHHDLLNHLQVIYGFLQLGKTERALEYVAGIVKDN